MRGKKIDKPLPKVYHIRSNFKIQNTDILVCFQLLKYWCTLYVHDFKDQLADCPPWLSHHYPAMAYAPKFLSSVHPFFPTRFLQLCTFKGESALWSWSLFLMRGKIRCRAEQGICKWWTSRLQERPWRSGLRVHSHMYWSLGLVKQNKHQRAPGMRGLKLKEAGSRMMI